MDGSCMFPNLDRPTVKKTYWRCFRNLNSPWCLCFCGIFILAGCVVLFVIYVIKASQTFSELIGISIFVYLDLILIFFSFFLFCFQNSSFSISWLPLKGLTHIIKSPLSMLEMVKTCCCDKQDNGLYKSSSSYTIFLCILAKVVKKAMKNNGPHPWKQVKGRYVPYISLS